MKVYIFRKLSMVAAIFICTMISSVHALAEDLSATAVIEINNQITGDKTSTDEQFVFKIIPENDDSPLPDSGTAITVTGEGAAEYKINYRYPGEYRYMVKEVSGQLSDYILDDTEYHIKISVFYDEQDKLCTQIAAQKSGSDAKCASIVFKNEYKKTETSAKEDIQRSPNRVQTGDNSRMLLAKLGLFFSGAGLLLCYCFSKIKDV